MPWAGEAWLGFSGRPVKSGGGVGVAAAAARGGAEAAGLLAHMALQNETHINILTCILQRNDYLISLLLHTNKCVSKRQASTNVL